MTLDHGRRPRTETDSNTRDRAFPEQVSHLAKFFCFTFKNINEDFADPFRFCSGSTTPRNASRKTGRRVRRECSSPLMFDKATSLQTHLHAAGRYRQRLHVWRSPNARCPGPTPRLNPRPQKDLRPPDPHRQLQAIASNLIFITAAGDHLPRNGNVEEKFRRLAPRGAYAQLRDETERQNAARKSSIAFSARPLRQ